MVSYRQVIEPEEGGKPPQFFIDLSTEEDLTQLAFTPTFDEDEYQNGIKIVTSEQLLLDRLISGQEDQCLLLDQL